MSPGNEMYVHLIKDAALLVALGGLYSQLSRLRRNGTLWARLLSGFLFGGIAVAGMVVPFEYQPGIIYDGRSIVMAMAGLFGGGISSLVAVVVAGMYRGFLGGVGVWAGLASLAGPALAGLAFRRISGGRPERLGVPSIFALGIAAHVLMLAGQLLLPWPDGLAVVGRIWLPIMLIFPAATALMGLLLGVEERHHETESALRESERKFKHVFETANAPKSITLPTGEVDVNKAFSDMLGYSPEALKNRKWQEVTVPDDIAPTERIVTQLLNGERDAARFTKRYLHSNGSIVWADVSVAICRDQAGRPQHFITTIVDITERRRAEEEVRTLAARNEALLGAIPDIVMEVDLDRRYTWSNPAGREFFGEDVVGSEASRYFVGEQDTYGLVQRLFEGDESTIHLESWQRRRDGEPRLLAWWCRTLRDSDGRVTGALSTGRDITDRHKGEEALAVSEANLHSLIASTDDIIVSRDREGRVVTFNEAFATIVRRMFGVEAKPGLRTGDLLPQAEKARWEGILASVVSGADHREEFSSELDGSVYRFERTLTPIRSGEQIIGSAEYTRDVTERTRTEQRLRQAQKMETVGQLAGGVAHDFNNMLQVIISFVDLSLGKVEPGEALHRYLTEVRRAAQRSAELTEQLLAFARRQTVSPKVVDLNEAVAHTQNMLQRLIGEDIDLAWMPGRDLWKVKVDTTQLDQVLTNLAVNARDAIGGVGRVKIETGNVRLDDRYCAAHVGCYPGEYVMLSVSDNGKGMDQETMSHLFEPFFTTKGLGKGTGLGLATVYGIVKQNKGYIDVSSEVGAGSSFKVYLPRELEEVGAETAGEAPVARGGTETVLMVEDEAVILGIAREHLETLGYRVLTAGSPEEAARKSEEHVGPIDLLITDVVMPQMNGRQLANQLVAARPGMKCLYMSGYTADVLAHRGVLEEGVNFIAKPFSLGSFAVKVREALEG